MCKYLFFLGHDQTKARFFGTAYTFCHFLVLLYHFLVLLRVGSRKSFVLKIAIRHKMPVYAHEKYHFLKHTNRKLLSSYTFLCLQSKLCIKMEKRSNNAKARGSLKRYEWFFVQKLQHFLIKIAIFQSTAFGLK